MATQLNSKLIKLLFYIFLLVYFFYIVLSHAPAAWAMWGAQQALPGFWASGIEGSLWRGKAQSAQIDPGAGVGTGKPIALGQLSWTLSPLSLVLLSPCANVSTQLPGQTLSGKVCYSLFGGDARLVNVDANAPLKLVADLAKVQASGSLSLNIVKARLNTESLQIKVLEGRMNVQQMRANAGEEWINIGTLGATLSPTEQGGLHADLFDIDSPYKSDLTFSWNPAEQWKALGTIAPKQGASDLVLQGLQILGEDLGDGSYRVQYP